MVVETDTLWLAKSKRFITWSLQITSANPCPGLKKKKKVGNESKVSRKDPEVEVKFLALLNLVYCMQNCALLEYKNEENSQELSNRS